MRRGGDGKREAIGGGMVEDTMAGGYRFSEREDTDQERQEGEANICATRSVEEEVK